MKGKNKIGTWVGFLLILIWCLFPVAWILSLSFKSVGETAVGSPQFLPKDPTFDNYKELWDWPFVGADPTGVEKDFQQALFNSFGISLISTVLSVILATLAAYAIARLEFRGKRLVLSLALAIAMFPVVALVGPLFDLWTRFGLFNTWPGLIIPYMSFTLPLAIWTLSAFFREIPWEMEQAAQVDGATSWQAFRKVIVPLAAPGCLHRGDPDVLLRLERVRARHLADVDHRVAHRAGTDVVLRRTRPVQPAVRPAVDRLGHRHAAGHRHRPVVPAQNRRRPHLRRSEGVKLSWPPSR